MAKRKSKVKKEKFSINNCRGVKIGDVIFYYDTNTDFVEAWPGIKMWLEVAANNRG